MMHDDGMSSALASVVMNMNGFHDRFNVTALDAAADVVTDLDLIRILNGLIIGIKGHAESAAEDIQR